MPALSTNYSSKPSPMRNHAFRKNTKIQGIRELTKDEIHFVSGGDALMDALNCMASIAMAMETSTPASIAQAALSCMNAVNNAPPPTVDDANCTSNNACVDGSVDGSDGNGSAGGDGGDSGSSAGSTD